MGGRQASLLILQDGEGERRIELEAGSFEMGRSEDNEICLPHISVSRRHARIFVTDDRVVFEDLGSGNGSWFKGRRIRTQTLVHGDEIRIDPFTLRLEVEEEEVIYEEVSETDNTHTEPQGGGHTEVLSDAMAFAMDEPQVAPPAGRLETLSGDRLEDSYEVGPEGLTMGRSEQRDIVLVDPAASRLHCEILFADGRYMVRDPGSANGLFINGRRSTEKVLDDGDTLRIGSTEFRWAQDFVGAPSTVAIEEAPPEHTENFSDMMMGQGGAESGPPPLAGPPHPAAPPLAEQGDFAANAAPPPADFAAPPPSNGGFGAAPGPAPAPFGAPAPFPGPEPSPPPQPALPPSPAPMASDGPETLGPSPAVGPPPMAGSPPPSSPGIPPSPAPFNPTGGGYGSPSSGGSGPAPGFGTPKPPAPGFGTSAAPDPLAPDLGATPTGGGFGGVEMSFGGGSSGRSSQGGFLASPINRISIGFMAVILLMLGFKLVKDSGSGAVGAGAESPAFVSDTPENELLYNRKMEEGWSAFRDGRYFSASQKFAEAMDVIPSRPDAKRMAAYSFEFVVIGTLEEVVAGRAASAEERAQVKADALAEAQKALDRPSMSRLKKARRTVQDAVEVVGEDAELLQAESDLNRKIRAMGGAIAARSKKDHAKRVEELYNSCQSEMNRRNYPQAKKCFKQVKADDPDRRTPYYVQAEDGIKRVDNEMRKRAQPLYQAGVTAMQKGDYLTARSKLKEALRLYPDYTSAKQKLDQVQSLLQQRASEVYKQAKVYENANQIDKAIVNYKEVQRLVGNPKDRLYRMAQERINSLVQ